MNPLADLLSAGVTYRVGWTVWMARAVPLAMIMGLTLGVRLTAAPAGGATQPPPDPARASPPGDQTQDQVDAPVRGQVIDEQGHPVAGARVVLFYDANLGGLDDRVVEETKSESSGGFKFKSPLEYSKEMSPEYGSDTYFVLAVHPNHALAWAELEPEQRQPAVTLTLTRPVSKTITVTDMGGNPIEGACVWLSGCGVPSRRKEPIGGDFISVSSDTGIVGATTGKDGVAIITNLPETRGSFRATLEGYADGIACHPKGVQGPMTTSADGDVIRMTQGTDLSGRITNEDGMPVADAKIRLNRSMERHFTARSDANGVYCFRNLPAEGYYLGPWTPHSFRMGETSDGKYEVTFRHRHYAAEKRQIQLQPGKHVDGFDYKASRGTLIRGKVIEVDTNRPLAGARLDGSSASGSLGLHSDANGDFQVHVLPGPLQFRPSTPPRGTYLAPLALVTRGLRLVGNAEGEVMYVAVQYPRIQGLEMPVTGWVLDPAGKPVSRAMVHMSSTLTEEPFSGVSLDAETDPTGHFKFKRAFAGLSLRLYAESEDRKLAWAGVSKMPDNPKKLQPVVIRLEPTQSVRRPIQDTTGAVIRSTKLLLKAVVEGQPMLGTHQTASTDENGVLAIDGILPGLEYEIGEAWPGRGQAYKLINPPCPERLKFVEIPASAPARAEPEPAAPAAVATQPATEPASIPPTTQPADDHYRVLHFVRLVVGKDRMTFQGKDATWEQLPGMLKEVPNRGQTVWELAFNRSELGPAGVNEAMHKILPLTSELGFAHLSEIGEHPLGSMGSPSVRFLLEREHSGPSSTMPATRLEEASKIAQAAKLPDDKRRAEGHSGWVPTIESAIRAERSGYRSRIFSTFRPTTLFKRSATRLAAA